MDQQEEPQPPGNASISPEESPYNPASAPASDHGADNVDIVEPFMQNEQPMPDQPAADEKEDEEDEEQEQQQDGSPRTAFPQLDGTVESVHDVAQGSNTPTGTVDAPNEGASDLVTLAATPNPIAHQSPHSAAHSVATPAPEDYPAQPTTRDQEPSMNGQLVAATAVPPPSTARLPHDRIGILEDRIAEEPRGAIDAFLQLVEEYKRRNKIEEARKVYDRALEVFPTAAELWQAALNMDMDNEDFWHAEQLFARSLMTMKIPSVALWVIYLNYIRRRYPLNNDPDGSRRKTVSEAFEFVLKEAGRDKDAGDLWVEYIEFLKSLPGSVTGTSWQDQQKKDSLRAGYRKAICLPHGQIGTLWSEYTKFEAGVDRAKSVQLLQQYSPDFMQARGARSQMERTLVGLNPTSLAILPPALGFDGDEAYMKQVAVWKDYIALEASDPLDLKPKPGEEWKNPKTKEVEEWKNRMLYVYRQALMPLRFWPEMWFEAVQFCVNNNLNAEADQLSQEGVKANPESCLLAFQRAERIEISTATESKEPEGLRRRGDAVRKPYDDVIRTLEKLVEQLEARQEKDIIRVKEAFQEHERRSKSATPAQADEDPEEDANNALHSVSQARKAQLDAQIQNIKRGSSVQQDLLKKTMSHAWIALMQAMRRVQGQGKPTEGEPVRGMRGVFKDLTKRKTKLTSDCYVAGALIEHHCYQDPVAGRIFDRGYKLFPEDAEFALAYIKHLLEVHDVTNARAIFKKTVDKLEGNPETLAKAKPLYAFWHDYECRYGELNLIKDLEQRMNLLFPGDPRLAIFSSRYSSPTFNPCAIRPVVSPATQTRPKPLMPAEGMTLPAPGTMSNSPRPSHTAMGAAFSGNVNSPKRRLDDSDNESQQPNKVARTESPLIGPLAGAAGRVVSESMKNRLRNDFAMASAPEAVVQTTRAPSSHPLHPNIWNFLKALPTSQAARTQLANVPPPPVLLAALQQADLSQVEPNHARLLSALAAGYNPLGQAQTQAQAYMQPAQAPVMGLHGQMSGWPQPGVQSTGMPQPQQPPYAPYGYGQPAYYH